MVKSQLMFDALQNNSVVNKFVSNFKKEQPVQTQQLLEQNNDSVNNLGKQALSFLNTQTQTKMGQMFQGAQPSMKQILFNVVISTLLKSFFDGKVSLSNDGASNVLFQQLKEGNDEKKSVKKDKDQSQQKEELRQAKLCNCEKNFMPVCGKNNQTYGNSCLARCDNQEFVNGVCSATNFFSSQNIIGNENQTEEKKKRKKKNKNQLLDMYNEATSKNQSSNNVQNFANNIQQQNTVVTQVKVQNPIQSSIGQNSCSSCPSVYQPVCGLNNQNYRNSCIAQCRNVEIKKSGIC